MNNIDTLLAAHKVMAEMGVLEDREHEIFVHSREFFLWLCDDINKVVERKTEVVDFYPWRYEMTVDGITIYCISSERWTKQRIWNERVNYMVSKMNDTMSQYTKVMSEFLEANDDDERVQDAERA